MGEEQHLRSKGVAVVVVNDNSCIEMMNKFIYENPILWNEDIGVE
jgi:creatinine deaminase